MPRGTIVETIPARRADVFRLLHDYSRRLEWDTLLQEARLTDGFDVAGLHATSICKGRTLLGGIAMKTVYVTYREPDVAAVRMVNRPPFIDSFAASIRHRDRPGGSSRLEYKYSFTARPRWLRPLLHPLMQIIFRRETERRLGALRRFFLSDRAVAVPWSKRRQRCVLTRRIAR
jgi:Polyketide cyclase / dehydrase and lipid transport